MLARFSWRTLPLLRCLLALIIGIIVSQHFPTDYPASWWAIAALALALVIAGAQSSFTFRWRWLPGLALLTAWILIGWLRGQQTYQHRLPLHGGETYTLQGTLLSSRTRARSMQWVVRVTARHTPDHWQPTHGKLLLSTPITHTAVERRPGDKLVFQARVDTIEPRRNPAAFDYQRYRRLQNIYHQAYVDSTDWHPLAAPPGLSIRRWADSWQRRLVQRLYDYVPGHQERSVAAALVLGYKDGLSRELRTSYARTGALHVLAVSGLHVGIVLLLLAFFLPKRWQRHRTLRWLRLVILLVGIWGFALMTGGSPSVLRAALLLSIVLLGYTLDREATIYNSLAGSALLLLLVDPQWLYHPGFQLSYTAVVGIIYFQPRIYAWWQPRHWVADKLWQLVTVSMAAQLTTLPISLHYFHQFPVYFWLSGLYVVLAAMVILCLGLTVALLGWIGPLGLWLGEVLNQLLWGVNSLTHLVEQLPGAVIQGGWVDGWDVALLYGAIGSLAIGWSRPRRRWWWMAAVLLLIVLGRRAVQQITQWSRPELVIYHHRRATLLESYAGPTAVVLSDDLLSPQDWEWSSQAYRWKRYIREVLPLDIESDTCAHPALFFRQGSIVWQGQKGLLLHPQLPAPTRPLTLDWVLVTRSNALDPEDFLDQHTVGQLILAASLTYRERAAWTSAAAKVELAVYDLRQQGACHLPFQELK